MVLSPEQAAMWHAEGHGWQRHGVVVLLRGPALLQRFRYAVASALANFRS